MEFVLLLGAVVLIVTPILAVIAFVRTNAQRLELDRLRAELSALKADGLPEPVPSASARNFSPAAPARVEPSAPQPARGHETPPRPELQSAARTEPPAPPLQPTPPPPPRKPSTDWARASSTFERVVVANWLIWVGALALALGGVFLVRFAWEQGYFGPEARTLAALVAGLAMIGASEWLRRRADPDAPGQLRFTPLAVAAAGAITLYAAAYAAGPLYALVPPIVALIGFILASAIAVALAVVHGVFLAILGFVGGYAAPLLVGGGQPEPLMVLGYILAVSVAALVLVRAFDWKPLVWVALGGSSVWTLAGWGWTELGTGPLALSIFLLALIALSSWLAWDDADRSGQPDQTVVAANGFWIIGGAGLVASIARRLEAGGELLIGGVIVYAAAAIFAGWRRAGFQPAPLLAASALIATAFAIDAQSADQALQLQIVLWAGAAITGLGGWFAMRRIASNGIMAIVAALTPVILLALGFLRIGNLEQGFQWGMGGGLLALLNLLALEGLSREPGGLDARRIAASAYALATFASSMFAVAASLQHMWMTVLFALHLPAIALIDRRFNLPVLRLAASLAGLVVSARLLTPGEVASYPIASTPVLNQLLILFGAPILALWSAARIFEASLKSRRHPVVQAMDVGAIVLTAAFLSVEVRHLVGGGDLSTDFGGLGEASAHGFAWTALALGLAARQSDETRPVLIGLARFVFAVAIAIAVLGLGVLYNPLFGMNWQLREIDGPLLFNLMTPSYLAPAILFAILGHLRHTQGRTREGHIAGFLALALTFLYATLEVRNYFHTDLSLGAEYVDEAERYAYSVVWILFAIVTLLVGIIRKRVSIRHAAMAVLALSVVKVFVFDMGSLDGVLRAASFFGLGLALIGIALLYQKLIFVREPKAPDAPV